MPSKNDISGLLKKTSRSEQKAILPQSEQVIPVSPTKRVGRPKKEIPEKRDYRVALSLTAEEGEILRAKAGLVRDATCVYAFLVEHGFFAK